MYSFACGFGQQQHACDEQLASENLSELVCRDTANYGSSVPCVRLIQNSVAHSDDQSAAQHSTVLVSQSDVSAVGLEGRGRHFIDKSVFRSNVVGRRVIG